MEKIKLFSMYCFKILYFSTPRLKHNINKKKTEEPPSDLQWKTQALGYQSSGKELTAFAGGQQTYPRRRKQLSPEEAALQERKEWMMRALHHPDEPLKPQANSQVRMLRARLMDFERRIFVGPEDQDGPPVPR